jgi:predicted phage tail protein
MDNSSNESNFQIFRSTDNVNFTMVTQVGANTTTFTDSGLAASTTYFYRVRAINASGNSGFSNTASTSTSGTSNNGVPAAPSNLAASAISSSQIQLNWQDNSTNESRFEIFRSSDGSSFIFRAQVGSNVTSFVDSGLTAGTTYFYRVRAVNSFGNSGWSNIASATPGGTTSGVPAAPSNLSATVASSTQINLNWQDNSSDETAFQIFQSTDGGVSFSQIAQVGSNVTSFSNNGLVTGNTYFYRVRAVNSVGNSPFSNTVSATPSSGTSGVPAGPTNLVARGVAPGQIQLTWQDNSNNENRFEVFRSTSSSGGFAFVAQVGAGVTNFTNTNLTVGGTFFYRVRAVNSAGNSLWTNVASAVASAPPTAMAAFSTTAISANLMDEDAAILT